MSDEKEKEILERLARIEQKVHDTNQIITKLDYAVRGNGRDGLLIEVDRLKQRSKWLWGGMSVVALLAIKAILNMLGVPV